jgi:flavin reductase (DIM6/NTAB) family NADH-FMN oxidoreductase RutF
VDKSAIAEVWRRVDRELWLVSAAAGGRRGGLIASFVMQAALTPELPRVLIGLAVQHQTRTLIEESRAFALHLLAQEQVEWVWRFGLQSGRDVDKFAGLTVTEGVIGVPLLVEAPAWLECRVEARWDYGGRILYVSEIVDGGVRSERKILTTARMLELAPPDTLARLRELVRQDCMIEEEAIRLWRTAPDVPKTS